MMGPPFSLTLKRKRPALKGTTLQMDAGADLVVTQLFYDVERFIQYEKDCRSVGIDAPIIPGLFLTAVFPQL